MTMIAPRSAALGSLSDLLSNGLRALDITAEEHDLAVSRYTAFGRSLDDHWGGNGGDNVLFPQGSFALGTVVRNVHRNDDIDIDAVALRDLDKTSISQADLKADVGVAAQLYVAEPGSLHPTLYEDSRCWTLSWPGMHFDILPALPNREIEGTGVLITDRDVRVWQYSDPQGYANWFHGLMRPEFESAREAWAKRMQVDEVPDWQVRTVLQQVVQVMKRHRDIHFADRLDDRPASVVITTLAALAYTGPGELYEVLRSIASTMPSFMRRVDGEWFLPNPVQPSENYLDSWAGHPERAEHFFEWIEAAERTFGEFGAFMGLDRIAPQFKRAFGERFATAATAALGSDVHKARSSQSLYAGASGALVASAPNHAAHPIPINGFAGGTNL